MPHRRLHMLAAATALSAALLASPALAQAVWHVAPEGSTIAASPDGSLAAPFATVHAALRNPGFKAGDTVLLLDGNHGTLQLRNFRYDVPVTIRSANPGGAHLDWVAFEGTASGITLRDVKVWPRDPTTRVGFAVQSSAGTARITVDGVEVRSHAASVDYRSWTTLEAWANRRGGIRLSGPDSTIANSTAIGVSAALTVLGENSRLLDNTVRGYAADALRALGNNNLVRGNEVTDCFKVDDTHMDGFQAWASNGRLVGLRIEGNRIFEWSGPDDNPLRCALQGIGLFDGFYQDLTIINNIVSSGANHGITVMGVENALIAHNTVVDARNRNVSGPYIAVFPHKNGTTSRNVVIANNAAMDIRVSTKTETPGLQMHSNTKIGFLDATFENFAAHDYRPRRDSGLIDTADPAWATETDITGTTRPLGKGPDRGAHEVPAIPDRSDVVVDPVVGGSVDAIAADLATESGDGSQSVPTFPTRTALAVPTTPVVLSAPTSAPPTRSLVTTRTVTTATRPAIPAPTAVRPVRPATPAPSRN